MSDAPTPPPGNALVAAARAARGDQRISLRAALRSSRAALQAGRQQAAFDAASRPPRWQPARNAAPMAVQAAETPSAPQPEPADFVMAPMDAPQDPAQPAETVPDSSIFATLVSDLPPADEPEPAVAMMEAPDAAVMPAEPTPRIQAEPDSGPELDPAPVAVKKPAPEPVVEPAPGPVVKTAQQLAPKPAPDIAAQAAPALALDRLADEASALSVAGVEAAPTSMPEQLPPPTPPITALGPGMLARLRMLGFARFEDLAHVDPAALRHALGHISRLINVEAWIAEARRLTPED
ncbi:hypothetical protein [Falsiroseomonas sp. E2-1-a20]|uniref:hypothetical protein n=1 Tax=Falsiroseomonas sp. E2-1-a20 TaxID=3239300 RepID=UPI003F3BF064